MSSNNPEEESQDLVKLRQGVVLLLAKANMQSCVLEAEKSQEEEKRLWKPESLRFPQKETAESWNLQSVPFCEQSDGTLVPAPHCFFLFRVFFFFQQRGLSFGKKCKPPAKSSAWEDTGKQEPSPTAGGRLDTQTVVKTLALAHPDVDTHENVQCYL